MYRKTYAEINLDKLGNNIKEIINVYKGYKYYIGVVKNNAYSHGFYSINKMIESGINYLAVSSLEEALEVRNYNKDIPVLVMEPIESDALKDAEQNNITITIDNVDYFKKVVKDNYKLKFHLKIDSGMNRFGLKNKDDVNYIYNTKSNLELEGIYTHLANGNPYFEGFNNQLAKFKELISDIDLSTIKIVHLDRSLTLELHDKIDIANGCRLGLIMYGYPFNGLRYSTKAKLFYKLTGKKVNDIPAKLKLEPAFTFKSNVIEIKKINKGEIVGYDGMNNATEDELIAIIPFGFADYLFDTTNEVMINNKKYPIIVINMDVTIVKINDSVKLHDEVEIFGNNISIKSVSNDVHQNIYKILTSVTTRVPRLYLEDGKKTEVKY